MDKYCKDSRMLHVKFRQMFQGICAVLKILKMRNRYASQVQDLKCTAEDAAKNIVAEALLEKLPAESLEVRRDVASRWLKNELTGIDVKMKNLDDKATEHICWGGRRLQNLLTYILDRSPEVARKAFARCLSTGASWMQPTRWHGNSDRSR